MNDLFEIVEDLEDIDTFGSDTTAFENIISKWKARLEDAQDEAERQYEMFAGVTRILDKRYEQYDGLEA
jgi:hypothetical protein